MRIQNAATAHLLGITHRNIDTLAECVYEGEWHIAHHIAQELQHLTALTLDTATREAISTAIRIGLYRHGIPVAILQLISSEDAL